MISYAIGDKAKHVRAIFLVSLVGLGLSAQSASASISVTNSGNAFTITGSRSSDTIGFGKSGGVTSILTNRTVVDNTTLGMICVPYSSGKGLACIQAATPTVDIKGNAGDDEIMVFGADEGYTNVNATVHGNAGEDTVLLGDGNDTVFGNDGDVDTVDCNGGADTFSGDPFDVTSSC